MEREWVFFIEVGPHCTTSKDDIINLYSLFIKKVDVIKLSNKREDVWSLPIWQDIISDLSDYVIDDILLELDKIHQIDSGRVYSNKGGWQSNDFFLGDNQFVDILINFIQQKVDIVAESLNTSLEVKNCWFNLNILGSFNSWHTHPFSSMSGVFYLDANSDQGNIVFQHPFSDGLKYAISNIGIEEMRNQCLNVFSIVPQNKKIILFPSFYPHYVEVNKTNASRISFAFNVVNLIK